MGREDQLRRGLWYGKDLYLLLCEQEAIAELRAKRDVPRLMCNLITMLRIDCRKSKAEPGRSAGTLVPQSRGRMVTAQTR